MLNQSKKNNKYLAYLTSNNLNIAIATIILKDFKKFYEKIKREFSTIKKLEKQLNFKFKY